VLAPCAGHVVATVDGFADMTPPLDRAHMAGNSVILDCDDVWVVLGHFQPARLTRTSATASRSDNGSAASVTAATPGSHICISTHSVPEPKPRHWAATPCLFASRAGSRRETIDWPRRQPPVSFGDR
jgi:hypothetical protein